MTHTDSPGIDIDALHRRIEARHMLVQTYPGCTSNCDQGRKLCPSPDACERGVDDDSLGAARGIVWALIASLVIWALATALWLSVR
jgi:hypothetical protein